MEELLSKLRDVSGPVREARAKIVLPKDATAEEKALVKKYEALAKKEEALEKELGDVQQEMRDIDKTLGIV